MEPETVGEVVPMDDWEAIRAEVAAAAEVAGEPFTNVPKKTTEVVIP